ncbi:MULTISPECIES: hypothetical protein [Nocardiaceae]|uniref:Antitoxin Xre/MbcA/ParS-like toxin-binding domain-containing protein n=1 Tax=Rhodococcoides kroppenstedtii TaxID=293050 RepID=A0ABS7NXD6_9NOCA|nr:MULTISPECIES: hypothetical protein [Rhodococcus]AMY20308.1 hypothetical protein A3Q40_02945 [Rhodococcus sp. PBTS 1]MBY6314957.1 hypothetical protein [Rhodococcus kroppenstedtii]MBY6322693.1 hypothetical protein [Rhodococcus kroppenstedtii]MBY6399993.1 hypothetical protein [Rhodococcus kroppenstedtii]
MAASHSRPDLDAYSEAALMGPAELTGALREVLGAKLVAYLGGVSETRITRQWAEGAVEIDSHEVIERLRFAYRVARLIADRDNKAVAQGWFQGMNCELDDRSPAQVVQQGRTLEDWSLVLAAARKFVA